MPSYSRETLEEIRARNDIVDVISSYIKLERRSGRYFGLCPFHTEKTGSFCVSPDSQMFHCFGCHESGDVISFIRKYESMEFTEALEFLAGRVGMELTPLSGGDRESHTRNEKLLLANREAAAYYFRLLRSPDGERALSYFRERGLSKELLQGFGLGYSGKGGRDLYDHLKEKGFTDEILKDAGLIIFDEKRGVRDRFFNRVMFPIMDVNKKVIAFGGRVMGDGQPKYLNSSESPIFNKSKTLYGLFAAKRSKRREFILCEGYMDVISAHQGGFDNAVATLGTALTEGHANILKRYKRPVYLCYDSDTAGRNAAIRGYEILRQAGISSKIMDLSPYKDPDELIKAKGPEEFEKRIEKAGNSFLTIRFWEYQNVDSKDPDAMTAFTHELARKISGFMDETERENYIRFCASRFGMNQDMLRRLVNNIGSVASQSPPPAVVRKRTQSQNKDTALLEAEGMVLYFLADEVFYRKVRGLLEKEDFQAEQYQEIYLKIADSMERNVSINPLDILEDVDEESLKNSLSASFFKAAEENAEKARVKKMTLLRVKKASYKRQTAGIDPADVEKLSQSLEYARETLDEIENIKFI